MTHGNNSLSETNNINFYKNMSNSDAIEVVDQSLATTKSKKELSG